MEDKKEALIRSIIKKKITKIEKIVNDELAKIENPGVIQFDEFNQLIVDYEQAKVIAENIGFLGACCYLLDNKRRANALFKSIDYDHTYYPLWRYISQIIHWKNKNDLEFSFKILQLAERSLNGEDLDKPEVPGSTYYTLLEKMVLDRSKSNKC